MDESGSTPRGISLFLKECRAVDRILPAALLIGTLLGSAYLLILSPPDTFPAPSIVKVRSGETLEDVVSDFKARGMVRSKFVLESLVRLLGSDRKVREGSYFFAGRQNALHIAMRLASGDFELNPVRVTVFEGQDARGIGKLLGTKLAPFDVAGFLALALPREGYLYPDTYFFYPGEEPQTVVNAMEHNFSEQTAPLKPALEAFEKTELEVLTMASLLEREARTTQDFRTVAGILWKRISIGMPLQVDAAFGYVLEKPLTELTPADIKRDSPYNTYLNKGLPPTPIGNPSARAVEAAVTPIKSEYLFYLSDRRGTIRYAATYEQHLSNIERYLR